MEGNIMCKITSGKFGDYVGKTECFSCLWREQCIRKTSETKRDVKKEPFYTNLYEKIRSYAYNEGCSMFKEDVLNGSRYESPLFFQRKDSIRIIGATENEIWVQHKIGQDVNFVTIPNKN